MRTVIHPSTILAIALSTAWSCPAQTPPGAPPGTPQATGAAQGGAAQTGTPGKAAQDKKEHSHEGHDHAGHKHADGQVEPIPAPVRPIPKGCWFEKIDLSFGTFVEKSGEHKLEGSYGFKNPTGKSYQITAITPSCKCQQLKMFVAGKEVVLKRKNNPEQSLEKPIDIKPGQSGTLKMQFDIAGPAGLRTGDVRVETTDPEMPTVTLRCEAKITPQFEVIPSVIALGKMGPNDSKEWSCKVRCLVRKEWKVGEMKPPIPHGIKVVSKDLKNDEKGAYYEIRGTYGPDLDEGAVGGNLLFTTDDPKQNFLVEIRAEVREKVKLSPGFFSFSSFPRNKAQEKTILIWPSDFSDPKSVLTVDRIEVASCTSRHKDFVSYEVVRPVAPAAGKPAPMIELKNRQLQIPADKVWKVVVRVKPDVPLGLMRVKAKVHFKGEGMVPKSFQFNGFPRRAR